MKLIHSFFLLLAITTTLTANEALPPDEEKALQQHNDDQAQEPGAVLFTPPEGWHFADPKKLPRSVKVMVVGKSSSEYPPSLNLATEKFDGTLKQYLKIVKEINDRSGAEWKDLGTIRTQAGDASLSQVDAKTKWGTERLMHVIVIRDGIVYIMTAGALKDEFPRYYKEFFTSMRSLRFNKNAYDMVSDAKRRDLLEKAVDDLKQKWVVYLHQYEKTAQPATTDLAIKAFESPDFQNQSWQPFKANLQREFSDHGTVWQQHVLNNTKDELLH
ncbi:MAG: hypothetical protein LLG04_12840 [Parachlamydia sp.]|nr:hypothetical protein [Parachlamydia sp.]